MSAVAPAIAIPGTARTEIAQVLFFGRVRCKVGVGGGDGSRLPAEEGPMPGRTSLS
jgi:hypothetical protein